MKTVDKKYFDYKAKLSAADEHAERLLVLLKEIDAVCMPAGITINEVEHLYTNLSYLVDFINKKRYWRLNK